jgi:hypothetical protein
MWAFGVLLYFMLNMEFPFSNLFILFKKKSIGWIHWKNNKPNSYKTQRISVIKSAFLNRKRNWWIIVLSKFKIYSKKFSTQKEMKELSSQKLENIHFTKNTLLKILNSHEFFIKRNLWTIYLPVMPVKNNPKNKNKSQK